MESLTEQINPNVDQTASMAAPSGDIDSRKNPRVQDRVTLGAPECRRVDQWLGQIEGHSKGFLKLSRSDLVNFLIRAHDGELSARELKRLRSDNYDPIKHIQWITPQIKDAIDRKDSVRVRELEAELRGVELMSVPTASTGEAIADSEATTTEAPPKKRRKQMSTDADAAAVTHTP